MGNIQKQEVASRIMSVAPLRQALVRAAAPLKYQALFWPFIRLRHAQGADDGGVLQPSMWPDGQVSSQPCVTQAGKVQRVPTL